MSDVDFSGQYNTPLSSVQESQYQAWVAQQSKIVGRNVGNDTYDYDLRGWWLANPGATLNGGHLTDQFKKPNHPTFSTGSQYSGQDGLQGGIWAKGAGESWTFTPGKTNLDMFTPQEMKDYFGRVEPGNTVVLPGIGPDLNAAAGMQP